MTTNPVQSARWLLDKLEDPFTMFPVESVVHTLLDAVEEAETQKAEHMGPWGVARKFWSVDEEQCHDKIGLLVGSLFVLGQASVTQTVAILTELRKHAEAQSVIPESKAMKLATHAPIDSETKLSKIVIVNAVSNYFKHVYEWPDQWDIAPAYGSQAETIGILIQLGMRPGEMTDNLLRSANLLGLLHSNPRAIARSIQEWREAWARVLYPAFGLPDPNK
jgi:hypothetical protein